MNSQNLLRIIRTLYLVFSSERQHRYGVFFVDLNNLGCYTCYHEPGGLYPERYFVRAAAGLLYPVQQIVAYGREGSQAAGRSAGKSFFWEDMRCLK